MGLKLPNPRKTEVFFDTEKLGRLYIFILVLGDMEGFYKEVKSVKKVTPVQYVRLLVKYVCHPEDKLEGVKYRPEHPTLNDDETGLISESEFEDFAEKYITKTGLNRKWVSKQGKSEEGVNSATIELGEVEHPRNEGEKWVDYLHRLAVIQEKDLNDQFKKIAEQFAGIGSFSKTLQEQIKNTFSLGDSLRKSVEPLNVHLPTDLLSKPFEQPFDYSEIAKISPLRGLTDRMDELIDTSSKSAKLLTAMNETQARIAGELKSSGDKTARYSKVNLFFGGVIILLTMFSIGLAVYLAYYGPKAVRSQDPLVGRSIEAVGTELKALNENTKTMLGDNKAAFEQMMREDAGSRDANQKALSKLIEQQSIIMTELKHMREQDRAKIELLEKQLKELSQKIKEKEGDTR